MQFGSSTTSEMDSTNFLDDSGPRVRDDIAQTAQVIAGAQAAMAAEEQAQAEELAQMGGQIVMDNPTLAKPAVALETRAAPAKSELSTWAPMFDVQSLPRA